MDGGNNILVVVTYLYILIFFTFLITKVLPLFSEKKNREEKVPPLTQLKRELLPHHRKAHRGKIQVSM